MLCRLVVYVTAWSSQSRFPCAKKEDRQCIAVPPPAHRAASPPPLQGLVNHDPFIEGVLSEGSEVMGHTPSWSRWKNNFLHHRSRHRSSSHWRSLAGLLAAPRASCAALMLRSTAQWVKNLDLVLNPFLISEKNEATPCPREVVPKGGHPNVALVILSWWITSWYKRWTS